MEQVHVILHGWWPRDGDLRLFVRNLPLKSFPKYPLRQSHAQEPDSVRFVTLALYPLGVDFHCSIAANDLDACQRGSDEKGEHPMDYAIQQGGGDGNAIVGPKGTPLFKNPTNTGIVAMEQKGVMALDAAPAK